MRPKSNRHDDHVFPESWSRADQMTWINRNLVDPTVASVELYEDDDGEIVARVWYARGGS